MKVAELRVCKTADKSFAIANCEQQKTPIAGYLLISGHSPVDFIDTSDPHSGTLALGGNSGTPVGGTVAPVGDY
ncbi:MAG TPA: hypothetical protein VFM18_20950 [Methanosarcina sp.]|nr:hypothetical protein [Methanosarcina sp.]